jgi:hypothetical protein
MRIGQVTLLAGATPLTTAKIYTPSLQIQNNAAAVVKVGDNTVSATRGLTLQPVTAPAQASTFKVERSDNRVAVFNYYVFGTAGQVIDFLYE